MWVRNQRKDALINVSRFEVNREFVTAVSLESNDELVNLGEYDSKESAIKVLDKIQTFIDNWKWSDIRGTYHPYVFQMPEHEEVIINEMEECN